MKCLTCFQTITADNRQTYKAGLPLPYCRTCVQKYLLSKKIKGMNPDEKKKFFEETIKELKNKNYSEEDEKEATQILLESGMTITEINKILDTSRRK